MDEKLLKPYEHKETEARIYKTWEESGFFNPDKMVEAGLTSPDAKPFTIVMPPPNVTGVLHMGHGLMLTVQDIMIRYKRMNGFRTLWIPGTDHAAIATQSKVENEIKKKEGLSRHDLGREELLKRVREFAQDSHDTIVSQVRKMGSSCDWSREAFTLDETRNRAVNTVFKMMYDDGLIYRGHRIVNWDPKGQTTIADDEIVYEERKGKLYTFKYSPDFPIAISTTRPETKVGDVAVAVHPSDDRYKDYVGKTFENIEFCGAKINIKVIADESVEKDFGTGALGVTPAHSMIDWEIADRHDLPRPQVINEYAKMVTESELLNGKKVAEAREIVVTWLRENNLLEKEEDVNQNIGTAERTGGVVEPLPKLQWFINVNKPIPTRENKTLKEIMREAVAGGGVKIIPDYFDKTYFNWIDNLRDWCISRQIWYGHRVPVWYKGEEIFVGENSPGEEWIQDEDTLDTWFSSGMWTFSTLGWPEKTKDLEIYHPTDVLETGYEILFFWVARMIMMTGYTLNTIPFHTVYLNGTVRDGQGRKMSKSLGNGIDPVEVADKFGADAGRMALVFGSAPGIDSRISDDKIKGQRNFANKVWNIGRFVLSNTEKENIDGEMNDADKLLREEFDNFVKEISKEMDEYLYHVSAEKIYAYIWNRFASEILEESKNIFQGEDESAKNSRKVFLRTTYRDTLKVLHSFMPFVTEELWSTSGFDGLLMTTSWPKV
ncbi:MAG: valine--tRNA ligase [Candidatus Pacebacteria bacterium]|nr:valine--tRNA ligase [Candidatus Paceibacterota bacterium]MBP9058602.1 valine--tRNA ligase [Candidatus Paceibacterota bacterium]MBP9770069.1 valine--tRNA ligase [Candidatus Paceibacterota bacterium]